MLESVFQTTLRKQMSLKAFHQEMGPEQVQQWFAREL
jgi:hypothetical protein